MAKSTSGGSKDSVNSESELLSIYEICGFRQNCVGSRRIVWVPAESCGLPQNGLCRSNSQIFVPFITTKREYGGSGLGLFICRQIAKQMGGELELAETSPEGATFRLGLPVGVR